MVLRDMRDASGSKEHHILKAVAPINILFRPFMKEYIAIDLYHKAQPAIIRISGSRGEHTVYLSNTSKYPDEETNQSCFKNQYRIEYRIKGASDTQNSKFYKRSLYLSLETEVEANIRISV